HVSHLSAGLAHATAQANRWKPAGHGEAYSSTGERDARRASGGRGRQGNEQGQGEAGGRERRRGGGQRGAMNPWRATANPLSPWGRVLLARVERTLLPPPPPAPTPPARP